MKKTYPRFLMFVMVLVISSTLNYANAQLAAEPTVSSSSMVFPVGNSTRIDLSWTNGNGAKRIVFMRRGQPVSFVPTDGIGYPINAQMSVGQFVIYNGTGNSTTLTREGDASIQAGATYYFSVYEYNDNGTNPTINYLATPLSASRIAAVTTASPTVSTSNLTFSSVQGDRMNLNWTNGDGVARIIIARQGSAVNVAPTDGVNYTNYESLGSGNIIIYNGTGSSAYFATMNEGGNALSINTKYYFAVYEYNGGSLNTKYKSTTPLTGNQTTLSVATEPLTSVTNAAVTSKYQEIDGSNKDRLKIEFNWPAVPTATGYLLIAREGTPVDPSYFPLDGVYRAKDWVFPNGQFVAQASTSNSTEFKQDPQNNFMLKPATTYYFAIIPYNGSGVTINYRIISPFTFSSQTLVNHPSTSASNLNATNVTDNSFTVNWTNGSGALRLLVVNTTVNPIFVPTNATDYGLNTTVATGQYVIFKGAGNGPLASQTLNLTTINGQAITAGTTYKFQVYEYNGTTTGINYAVVTNPLLTVTTNASATEPTTAGNSLGINAITTNSMNVYWNNGNGARRIAIASTSPITATPVDGTVYTVGTDIGGGTGQYVVYNNANNSFSFTSIGGLPLNAATTYYVKVFEYNGSGTGTNYLTSSSTGNSASTLATEPTASSSSLVFSSVTDIQMNLSWTNGNGARRLVIARASSAVTFVPTDNTSYALNAQPSSGQFVAYDGVSNSFVFNKLGASALTPGVTYYFAVYEYNGGSGIGGVNYYATALTGNQTTLLTSTEPTTNSNSISENIITTNSMNVYWNDGNGANRLVVASTSAPISATPNDGTTYTVGTDIGSGSGQYVVYNGAGHSFSFSQIGASSLTPGTTYYISIFEYNGSGVSTNYLTSTSATAVLTTMALEPTSASSSLTFSGVTDSQMNLNWINGNGARRVVIVQAGSAVTFVPSDNVSYTQYAQASTGQYVAYDGTANSFTFNRIGNNALSSGVSYYFAVYEYNGSARSANYYTSALTGNQTTLTIAAEPTANGNSLGAYAVTSSSMTVYWNSGNGAKRLVIASTSPISVAPSDATGYAVGTEISVGSGVYAVYNGGSNAFSFTSIGGNPLTPGTLYYFKLYEFNGAGTSANYLTTGALSASKSTLAGGRIGLESAFAESSEFNGYPNPATNVLNVNIPSSEHPNRTVTLYNSMGISVYEEVLSNDASTIIVPIDQLNRGLYYLTLKSGHEVLNQEKIVLQ